ncbi:MAG: type II secretion system protein GspH, partial [Stenotrophobium sp.]
GSPDATLAATPAANGTNWMIVAQPLLSTDAAGGTFVQGGQLANLAPNVAINSGGVATFTFTAFGRVAPAQPDGTAITFPVTLAVSAPHSDRPLDVVVAAGGETRLCDPAKLITSSPDGC